MGQSLSSINDMVSYAGDLRRAARQEAALEDAPKIRRAAAEMEQAAFARLSLKGEAIGRLLDTFA